MKYQLPIALTSATLLLMAQVPAKATVDATIKSGPQVNDISQKTTLLIMGISEDSQAHGSGSIIAREGNSCVGVTNAHVVAFEGSRDFTFVVRTYDGEVYPITEMHPFTQEDLAIVEFECTKAYEPIPLATYQLSPGQSVYLSGWPGDSTPNGNLARQFTSGSISTILETPLEGYQVGYTNVTNSGMSGGQVLDEAGRLVAIHGLGARENPQEIAYRLGISESAAAEFADKTGFNYGIPVTTLLARASQMGLNYPITVAYASPQAPTNGASAAQGEYVYEPGANDQVDFDDVMDNADRLLETVGTGAAIICTFFGC